MRPAVFLVWGVIMFLSGAGVLADDLDTDWQALFDLRYEGRALGPANLTPSRESPGRTRHEWTATGRLSGEASYADTVLRGQLRMTGRHNAHEQDNDLAIDEAFAETRITDNLFVFGGRRNIAYGQAYGVSPADIFLDNQAEDQDLNETRRRREVTGQDMLGVEAFLSDTITASAFAAPEIGVLNQDQPDRFLASVDLLFPESDVDVKLLAFKDERPGGAVSASMTLGDSWVFFVDGALRRGRDRGTLAPTQTPLPGSFTQIVANRSRITPSMTIGGNYTSDTGVVINLEYFRNSDGYDADEWRTIEDLIRVNADNDAAGRFGREPEDNLRRLNGALNVFSLRRNYLFGRIALTDLFWDDTRAEATDYHNLDDASGVLSLRLEQDLEEALTLGAYLSWRYGDDFSEFRLRGDTVRAVVYATYQL